MKDVMVCRVILGGRLIYYGVDFYYTTSVF